MTSDRRQCVDWETRKPCAESLAAVTSMTRWTVSHPLVSASCARPVQYRQLTHRHTPMVLDGIAGTFLCNEGINMLDAWANTGMAEPIPMATITVPVTPWIFKDGFETGDTTAW